MKARGKLVSLLMALVCLLPIGVGLLGFGDSASAATPQDVTVTLHKKMMDDFPTEDINNTGLVLQDIENNYLPLKGVEFRPYDITTEFYTKLAEKNLTGTESEADYNAALKEVSAFFSTEGTNGSYIPKEADAVGAAQTTGDDGTVQFILPDRDASGEYKVYLFVETKNPDNEQHSQPLVLVLPAKDPNTKDPLTSIHLYPKNKIKNIPTKELLDDEEKPVDPTKDRFSYDIDKEIQYKATFMIPSQIGEILKDTDGEEMQTRYSKLVFKDEIDTAGVRFVDIDKIMIGNTDVKSTFTADTYSNTTYFNKGNDYTAAGKAGFEIAMRLSADKKKDQNTTFGKSKDVAQELAKYKNQKIEIYYTVKFTKDTPVDKDIKNNFYVDLQQSGKQLEDVREPEVVPPPITTGGKRFIKHAAEDVSQTLKGAEFVVTKDINNEKHYLKGNTTDYDYTWVKVDAAKKYPDAFVIKSEANDGKFEIKGLEYGDYELVETKAPNGYKLLDAPVPFTVSKDSYDVEDPLRDKVANVSRDGFLPSTGGAGIVAFLVIGLSLMGIAVFRYRKTQHAA